MAGLDLRLNAGLAAAVATGAGMVFNPPVLEKFQTH
jgi:hypothetical protein